MPKFPIPKWPKKAILFGNFSQFFIFFSLSWDVRPLIRLSNQNIALKEAQLCLAQRVWGDEEKRGGAATEKRQRTKLKARGHPDEVGRAICKLDLMPDAESRILQGENLVF